MEEDLKNGINKINSKGKPSAKTTLLQTVWMLSAAGLIQLACFYAKELDLQTLMFISLIVAIPIWLYKIEYALFSQRAILSTGSTAASYSKKIFWSGHIKRAFTFLISFTYAILLGAVLN